MGPDLALNDRGQVAFQAGALEEASGETLGQGRRVEVGEGLGRGQGRPGPGRGGEPAHAEPGGGELGEAALVDDEPGAVEGLERGRRRLVEVDLAVQVALDHRHAVAHRQVEDPTAALPAEDGARGVLEGGHQVNELRSVTDEGLLEQIGWNALVVDGHADHVGAGPAEGHQRADEGRRLRHHHVARLEEGAGEDVQPLLAPRGDQDALGRHFRSARVEPAAHRLPEHGIPARTGRAVEIEGGVRRDLA